MTFMLRYAVLVLCVLVPGIAAAALSFPTTDEGSDAKATAFAERFAFHDPVYFALGFGGEDAVGENVTYADFQISFRFEMLGLDQGDGDGWRPWRGLNLGYTQRSYWDLDSRSQPFFDTTFKPALFILYQWLGGRDLSWVHRLDLEGGYQHQSNGKGIPDSRSMETWYFKPTFIWRLFDNSFLFVAPRFWNSFQRSALNEDIHDYWGNLDLEVTWRADFGLQLETHYIPAENVDTFGVQATYPLDRLWKPLAFYALVDYRSGAGETLLRYDLEASGWIFGIALSR